MQHAKLIFRGNEKQMNVAAERFLPCLSLENASRKRASVVALQSSASSLYNQRKALYNFSHQSTKMINNNCLPTHTSVYPHQCLDLHPSPNCLVNLALADTVHRVRVRSRARIAPGSWWPPLAGGMRPSRIACQQGTSRLPWVSGDGTPGRRPFLQGVLSPLSYIP